MFPYSFYINNLHLCLVGIEDSYFLVVDMFHHWSFKDEIFNTNNLSHLLWVDMELLMAITHPKDPHSETLQLRAFS